MKHRRAVLFSGLILQACLPEEATVCLPCTPDNCALGEMCTDTAQGALCIPAGETPALCGVAMMDAGVDLGVDAAVDAGFDAGEAPDVGSRCSSSLDGSIEWVESERAGICFTRSEITVGQFEACIQAVCTSTAPRNYAAFLAGSFPWCNIEHSGRGDWPANCVLQEGAADFCALVGGRLPTKEEWIAEASAEGSRSYPWGEQTPTCEYAVMDEGGAAGCGLGLTGPVCSKPMGNSVSGLCDMSGSVWEFVSDSTQSRPQLLGGSWLSGLKGGALRADGVAVLSRSGIENNIGFRCAKPFE